MFADRTRRFLFTLAVFAVTQSIAAAAVDVRTAERFASLALACVHKEYPNKIAHAMSSDADLAPPRDLTPAFYGCYDWHSSVHGHWLLVRLARQFPDAPFAAKARTAIEQSITPEHIAAEVAYLRHPARASFERPYGLAWLLQLAAELREWDPALARTLQPLESAANERLKTWLPKLSRPMRVGEHSQSAFAFGLILDATNDPQLVAELKEKKERIESEVGELQEKANKDPVPDPGDGGASETVTEDSLDANLKHLPRGLVVMLLEPVPWRTPTSSNMNLARWENFVWYPLLLLAAIGLFGARKHLHALAFPILAGGGMLIAYALSEGNIGTAYRHRGESVWAIVLLAGLGAQMMHERWQKRREEDRP